MFAFRNLQRAVRALRTRVQKKRQVENQIIVDPEMSTTATAHDVDETPERPDTGITTTADSVNATPEYLVIGVATSIDDFFPTQEANREPFHLDENAIIRTVYRDINSEDEDIMYDVFKHTMMNAYRAFWAGSRAHYSGGIFTMCALITGDQDVEETEVARELAADEPQTREQLRMLLLSADRQEVGTVIWLEFAHGRFEVLIALYPGFF